LKRDEGGKEENFSFRDYSGTHAHTFSLQDKKRELDIVKKALPKAGMAASQPLMLSF